MSESKDFEKRVGGVVRTWRIEREGIRCHTSWGVVGGVLRGHGMTLDDEFESERHFRQKVREKVRQGYATHRSTAGSACTSTTSPSGTGASGLISS